MMCEGKFYGECLSCPYFYNSELCLIEDDYIEDKFSVELRSFDSGIKIDRIYKE